MKMALLYFANPEGFGSMDAPGQGVAACDLQPGRLWSLADMINANISGLGALCSQLRLEELLREQWGHEQVPPDQIEKLEGWLEIAGMLAEDFEMNGVKERISIFKRQISLGITQSRASEECRVLLDTICYELKWHLIYRYPKDKGAILASWKEDWGLTVANFPSAEEDVRAAVDLWALHHSTASVFHLMRVLEHGLRALAHDLGLTFDVQNWQNILDQIEAEVRQQSTTLPRGLAKSERLRFLSEAAKEFHFFKDGWRNYVSHNRSVYDENQARSVMDHTRSFMNGLAAQLSEQP